MNKIDRLTHTETAVPYLHRNARSRLISPKEIREVFEDEVFRGLQGISRDGYLRKVMP